MSLARRSAKHLSAGIVVSLLITAFAPAAPTRADEPVETEVVELAATVEGSHEFPLSAPVSHVAVHWPAAPDARMTVALSADGANFGPPQHVEIDEVGAERGDGRTYGQLIVADGATSVRVTTDRPLAVELLVLDTTREAGGAWGFGADVGANVQPTVIPRAGWGADESLRFDENGDEIWEREYFPIQKLVVHHTAMGDGDPDPAATVRAIYYYHAVTQEWGDIGYNFLVDAAGRVYEGRSSREYPPGASPSGDDVEGRGVAAGHARAYNAGSVGIALLGSFDTRPPTRSAQDALVRLLSWSTAHHRLDPRGHEEYVNPISGDRITTATISGHRDYNPTACPGGTLYAQLPTVRDRVAISLVERVSGPDRYGTAAAVSANGFSPGLSTAFIATGTNFPDALAGGPAAASLAAPILLTQRDSLPAATAGELRRLAPRRIVVLGGPGAVSDAVLAQLQAMAPDGATRLAGADRYATAVAISAAAFGPGVPAAFIATGANFPDALAGGPVAGAMGAPILLTQGAALPSVTAAELRRLAPARIYVLGGPGAVSDAVLAQLDGMAAGGATRVAGEDRYATAASIIAFFFSDTHFAYVAVGTNFPDALAASAPAGMRAAPVVLVRPSGVPPVIAAQLDRLRPPRVLVLGGAGVIPESVVQQVRAAMGLP